VDDSKEFDGLEDSKNVENTKAVNKSSLDDEKRVG